jgi:hypothetical protein
MKVKLCWHCNKRLVSSHAVIEFNGSHIAVHKACRKDAENIIFRNEITFRGEKLSLPNPKPCREDY